MTTEQLNQYRAICAEISDIRQQLENSYAGDTVQSGSKHPYSVHSVRIEGYKSDRHTTALLSRLSVLEHSREEIEAFVDNISDSEMRQIVQLRYIRGRKKRSWQYIAMKLGYCSEHTPKRKLKKFFSMAEKADFK